MPAAPEGTIIITAPGPDGTGAAVTLHYDPDTGTLAEPFAITVEHGAALIDIHHVDGTTTKWACIPGAHITARMLADNASITSAAHIHTIVVTADIR